MFTKAEETHGQQAARARRECHEVAASRGSDGARHAASGCDPTDQRDGTDASSPKEEPWNEHRAIEETKCLVKENKRPRETACDLKLNKLILLEATKGNGRAPLAVVPVLIMFALTRNDDRYGYLRSAALPRRAGGHVNGKRVQRLWRFLQFLDFISRQALTFQWRKGRVSVSSCQDRWVCSDKHPSDRGSADQE